VGIVLAWFQSILSSPVPFSVADSALKALLLLCYLVLAMGLFREETLIVVAKVVNKFTPK
jgi:hypothetical protein